MSRRYRYPWPASAISSQEMALLYQVRKSGPRQSITELIARAIRQTYGSAQSSADPIPHEDEKKEAA